MSRRFCLASSLSFLAIQLCGVAFSATSASAQTTRTWVSATGGDWHTAINWSGNQIPADGEAVVIPDLAGSQTISIGAPTASLHSITAAEHMSMGSTVTLASISTFNAGLSVTGGFISGTGSIVSNGPMNWIAGTIAVAGGLEIASDTLSLGVGQYAELRTTLRNRSTVSWLNYPVYFGPNASVINEIEGTWVMSGDVAFASNAGSLSFTNAGSLQKLGAGTITFQQTSTVTNTGNIVANGGTLQFDQLVNQGTVHVAVGTTMNLSVLTNSGTVQVDSQSLINTFNATILAGSTLTGSGTLRLTGGIVTVPSTITAMAPIEMLGGTLSGAGQLVAGGGMTWAGGLISLTGGVEVAAGQTLAINGAYPQLSTLLRNRGTVAWATGTQAYYSNATVVNEAGATWTMAGTVTWVYNGGSLTITNAGVLQKTGTGVVSIGGQSTVTTTGTLAVQAGTLTIGGEVVTSGSGQVQLTTGTTLNVSALTNGGTVQIAAGATLVTVDGALQSGSTMTGTGIFRHSGTMTVSGSVTSTVVVQIAGGNVTGTGQLTLGAGGTWEAGTLSLTGGVEVAAGQTLAVSGAYPQLNTLLRNRGTVTWASGTQAYYSNGTVVNEAGATWTMAGTVTWAYNGGSLTFTNEGLLRFAGPTGAFSFGSLATVINRGTIAVRLGGAGTGQFDRIDATQLTIGGTLDVTLINGYAPTATDQFQVVAYTSGTGSFANIDGHGQSYEAAYFANVITIGLPGRRGTIGGRITGQGVPLANVAVSVRTLTGTAVGTSLTNSSGDYAVPNVPSGAYVVTTQAPQNFVDEVWDNIPCFGPCHASIGTPITMALGASITDRHFDLSAGAALEGTVTGSGAPLTGVTVALYSSTDVLLTTATTNAQGRYAFTKLATGTYRLLTAVGAQNFIDEVYQNVPCIGTCSVASGVWVVVSAGTTQTGYDFDLDAAASVSGVVTSAGTAQLGVTVGAYTAAGVLVGSASTDSSGAYNLKLAPGTYYLRTSATTNVINEVWNDHTCVGACQVTSGDAIVVGAGASLNGRDFDLAQGGTIAGRVTNATSGAPLAALTVVAFDSSGQEVGRASTNGSGNYQIVGLVSGRYTVRSTNAHGMIDELYENFPCDYRTPCPVTVGTAITIVTGRDASGIDLTLTPGGTITGRITHATNGAPIANAMVSVWDLSGRLATRGITNNAGVYTTAVGLPTGTYVAVATAPGFIRQRYSGDDCFPTCVITEGTPIVVTLGVATSGIDFALRPGGRISGVITDGLYPIAGIKVLIATADGTPVTKGMTDAEGRYISEEGLPPGSYKLKTLNHVGRVDKLFDNSTCVGALKRCAGGTLVAIAGTETATGKSFALSPGARFSGRIIDDDSGAPLANVGILVFDEQGDPIGEAAEEEGEFLDLNAVTDADGRFTVTTGLPTGNYYLATRNVLDYVDKRHDGGICVQGKCDVRFNTTPQVIGGVEIKTVDFRLKKGGGIAGIVRANDGKPLPDVTLETISPTGKVLAEVVTGAGGDYNLLGSLAPGHYYVRTRNKLGFVDEVFDNLICLGCPVTGATKVSVSAETTTSAIDFTLDVGGVVTGTIFDRTRRTPLSLHPVSLLQKDSSGAVRVVARTMTDRNGVYSVGLPRGTYLVQADGRDGYQVTLWTTSGGVARYRRALDGTIVDACPAGICDPNLGGEIPIVEGAERNQINIDVQSCGGLTLGPSALPNSPFGVAYPSTTLVVSGGLGPYGYFVSTGELPPGLLLNSITGALTGTPLAAGTTSFEVTGIDGDGCAAARIYTVTFCGYGVPTNGTVGPLAGTGTFPVNLAAAGCGGTGFTATSNAPWLVVTGVTGSGTPNGLVSYSYQARGNVSTSRTGTISAAGNIFTLTQTGTPVVITATPVGSGVIGPGANGTETIVVTANTTDATWSAIVNQPWLSVSPASGVGSGSVTVSVQRNPTPAARQATITIAGIAIPITQRANGVPGAPTQLGATVANFTANFGWLPPLTDGDATSYELQAGLTPGQNLVQFQTTSTSFTVPQQIPPGQFYFRVVGKNEFGVSDASADWVLTMGPDGTAPPGPPSNFTATVNGTIISMAWGLTGTGSPATRYQLEAGTRPGLADIATLPLTGTSFTSPSVPQGLYYIRVRGVNANGPGLPSNEVRAVVGNPVLPPTAPQNLTHTVSGRTVTLTWQAPSVTGNNAATGYVLEAGTATGLSNIVVATVGNTLTFSALAPPGTYFVRVRASNGAGPGDASNEVTLIVP